MVSKRSCSGSEEPAFSAFRLPICGPFQTQFRRKVEHNRQIGPGRTYNGAVENVDNGNGHAARGALIGAGRIAEAVADHPSALRERGPDCKLKMRFAGCVKENCFTERTEALGFPRQQHIADRFCAGGSARLACLHDVDAGFSAAFRPAARLAWFCRRPRPLQA